MGQPAKTRHVVPSEDIKDIQKQMVVLSKQQQAASLAIRQLRAVNISVYLGKEDLEAQLEAKEAVKNFLQKQKEMKEAGKMPPEIRAALGNPNNHVFNRWVLKTKEKLQTLGKTAEAKEIEEACKEWEKHGWKILQRHLPLIKYAKAGKRDLKKLEISCPGAMACTMDMEKWKMTPTYIWVKYVMEYATQGMEELLGTAPTGGLEKATQGWLDAHGDIDI